MRLELKEESPRVSRKEYIRDLEVALDKLLPLGNERTPSRKSRSKERRSTPYRKKRVKIGGYEPDKRSVAQKSHKGVHRDFFYHRSCKILSLIWEFRSD